MGYIFGLIAVLLVAGCSCVPLSWNQLNLDVGATRIRSRWFAGAAFANDMLYVFGGQGSSSTANDSGILGDTWRLDVTSSSPSWAELSPAISPSPRYGFVSGVMGNYWIISHGCDFTECFSDTWALDLTAVNPEWELILNSTISSGPIPSPRFTVAGGVYPGTEQFWLSMGEAKSGRILSDTWVLQINDTNPLTGDWSVVSDGGGLNQYHPFIPHARSLHAGAPLNTSTFAIFGGCASGGQVGGPCPLGDNWILDLDTAEWESFSSCVTPAVRSSIAVVPSRPGQAFILHGGNNYSPGIFPQLITPLNETATMGEVYIMNTGPRVGNLTDWKRVLVAGASPDRREGASIAVDMTGSVVYLFGGRTTEDAAFHSDIWTLTGDGEGDVDEGCPPPYLTYVHLHGLLMYMAWGLALPLGVLLGRYYRWTWPCWFILHIFLQSLGVLLTVTAFVIIFLVGSYSSPDFPHAIVGIILTFLMLQQFLSGIFHPCVDKENGKTDPDDKSAYRKCWEVYHGASGFISIAIGFGQVTLGVLLVNAPMIVWSIWAALGILWVITFVLHEIVYICYKLVHKIRKKEAY